MPAEWEPHEATWIAWPHNREDWPGRFAPIPWVYGEIVRKLAAWSASASWCRARRSKSRRAAFCDKVGANLDAVEFFPCPTDRVWTRDLRPDLRHEPARARSRSPHWRFNAWAKYDDWQHGRHGPRLRRRSG